MNVLISISIYIFFFINFSVFSVFSSFILVLGRRDIIFSDCSGVHLCFRTYLSILSYLLLSYLILSCLVGVILPIWSGLRWMTYFNISKCPSVFVNLVCSRTVGYLFAPATLSSFLHLLLQAALQAAFLHLLP